MMGAVAEALLASGLLDGRRTVAGQQSGVSAIEAIEKAMEGVTPGPWQVHQTVIHGKAYGGHWVEVANEDQLIQISGSGGARSYTQRVFDTQGHDDNEANARYIAACSPDRMGVVLALARQAEALQRENAELREALRPFADVADLVDSETEGVADSDEFQMHFHDYLMASWKLSIFRRARALIGGENAGN